MGAVAIDASGRIAAATSTGGLVGKRQGRVGDSPIIGAGTYADDSTAGASATGYGEEIIRVGLAKTTCDLVRIGVDAQRAAEVGIDILERRVKGRGGIITIDRFGRTGAWWNTVTMTHGIARDGEEPRGICRETGSAR